MTRQATVIADAGPAVGLGHLSRAGAAAVALGCHGFEVRALLCGDEAEPLTRDGIAWTPMDGLPTTAGLTLVDSYLLDRDAFPVLRERGPVVAFVDPVRGAPDADLVIGHGLNDPHALEALPYACLRPMFWGLEPQPVADHVQTVLVSVGGSALAGGAALAARVADALPGCRVRFVVGPHGSDDALPPRVEPVHAPPDLLGELLAADVVVSAAGQTMLEAACAATPCVAIALVDNQRRQLATLERAGAVVAAEPDTAAVTVADLAVDAERRATLAAQGRQSADGYGALRLAWRLAALADAWPHAPATGGMRLRAAARDDARLLFDWRNDPGTRESSFSTEPVSWADHRAWVDRAVDDPRRALYVAEDARGPVGTVRVDLDPAPPTISITVAPERRGEGHASRLIAAAAERHGPPIVALIKPGNDASVRAFERAGFRRAGAQDSALRLVYDG